MRFLKSAPSKTPIYQISSKSDKISILVIFRDILPKFFGQKSSDQIFDIIFGFRTFENLCIPNFSKIGGHLKIAKKCLKVKK